MNNKIKVIPHGDYGCLHIGLIKKETIKKTVIIEKRDVVGYKEETIIPNPADYPDIAPEYWAEFEAENTRTIRLFDADNNPIPIYAEPYEEETEVEEEIEVDADGVIEITLEDYNLLGISKKWQGGKITDMTELEIAAMTVNETYAEIAEEIARLKAELSASDYKAIKFAEGIISAEDYEPIKAERQALRERINELKIQLEEV